MHWVLQSNLSTSGINGFGKLTEVLDRFQISWSAHKVIPFVGELTPEPVIGQNAIYIGSYSMRHAAKNIIIFRGFSI